jgi:hypothetical protein
VLLLELKPMFSWQVQTTGPDLFLRQLSDGAPEFDFYLGGGGCIQSINSAQGNLLSSSDPAASLTGDEVGQLLCWCLDISTPPITGVPDTRWNINQAGDTAGQFQPIVVVNYSQTNQTLDVWSVGAWQWFSQLQAFLSGNVPLLTRYQLLPNGVLGIRRVLISPYARSNAYDFFLQNYLPLNPLFSTVAYRFDQNNKADVHFDPVPGPGISRNTPASTGFCVTGDPAVGQAQIAQVWGTAAPLNNTGAVVTTSFQSGATPEYVESTPQLDINPCLPGTVIDWTMYVIARPPGSDPSELVATIGSCLATIPPPAIYAPTGPFNGDVAQTVATLQGLAGQPGHYVNQLAPLLLQTAS